jgi:hypothetical protein
VNSIADIVREKRMMLLFPKPFSGAIDAVEVTMNAEAFR